MSILTEFFNNFFRNRFRTVLDIYARSAPSSQNAINVFQGEWISRFPPPHAGLIAGTEPTFDDRRVSWALSELGGVQGQTVLELGPLEGGHSCMLDRAGAKSVLGIEANSRAYLRCLVAREIVGAPHVTFQLGDFVEHLATCSTQYDFILAAGVLYHMSDPARLLKLISEHTRRTYIWTHYFDDALIRKRRRLHGNFSGSSTTEVGGQKIVLHRHEYRSNLQRLNFLGGTAPFSQWLSREDIIACLKNFGFDKITVGLDDPDHRNGPNFELVPEKT